MRKIIISFAVLAVSMTFLFQNCGSPKAELNPEDVSEFSEEDNLMDPEPTPVEPTNPNKTAFVNNYQTTALQGDNVSLSAPESIYNSFSDGLCQWTYTSLTNAVSTLSNPSRTLALPSIQSAQAGTYKLHCENSAKEHSFIFKIFVQIPTAGTTNGSTTGGSTTGGTTTGGSTTGGSTTGGSTTGGTPTERIAIGYIYYKGSLKGQTSTQVTRAKALSDCKEAIAGKGKGRSGFVCRWDGQVIHSN